MSTPTSQPSDAPKRYSERELIEAQRQAFYDALDWEHRKRCLTGYERDLWHRVAANRYPLPTPVPVERPRVVWNGGFYWRVMNGALESSHYPDRDFDSYQPTMPNWCLSTDRISVLYNLFQHPTEWVYPETGAVVDPSRKEEG